VARRADIECFARDLEARGRARATVTRRLCTIAGFYRYAVEEELLDHSPAAHVRRPRLDYESHATGRSGRHYVSPWAVDTDRACHPGLVRACGRCPSRTGTSRSGSIISGFALYAPSRELSRAKNRRSRDPAGVLGC
jgi:hypothetical protein